MNLNIDFIPPLNSSNYGNNFYFKCCILIVESYNFGEDNRSLGTPHSVKNSNDSSRKEEKKVVVVLISNRPTSYERTKTAEPTTSFLRIKN